MKTCENFIETVGTSGIPMMEVNFLEAIYHLDSNNIKDHLMCVLHPAQIADLRKSLNGVVGAIWGGASEVGMERGAFASLYGVDIYRSVDCPIVNEGKDCQGVMMSIDNDKDGVAIITKYL